MKNPRLSNQNPSGVPRSAIPAQVPGEEAAGLERGAPREPRQLRNGERERGDEERSPVPEAPARDRDHGRDGHGHGKRVGMDEGHEAGDRSRTGEEAADAPRVHVAGGILAPHRLPPEHPDHEDQRHAHEDRPLRQQHRDEDVPPAQLAGAEDRVVVPHPLQQPDQAAPRRVHFAEEQDEAEAAAEEDEERRGHGGQPVTRDQGRPPEDERDQREGQGHVHHEQRVAQRGAGAHEHGGHEVDEERIGQADPGQLGMLGREVRAVDEAVDHPEVERKVADVVVDPGVDGAVGALEHRALEEAPHEPHRGPGQQREGDRPAVGVAQAAEEHVAGDQGVGAEARALATERDRAPGRARPWRPGATEAPLNPIPDASTKPARPSRVNPSGAPAATRDGSGDSSSYRYVASVPPATATRTRSVLTAGGYNAVRAGRRPAYRILRR